MKTAHRNIMLAFFVLMLLAACAGIATAATKGSYPKIELYTAPGCKSCKAASEYLGSNGIPYTAKDVTANESYLDEMSERYRCSSVPLIVIGDGKKVLRGFVPEAFQLAVREVLIKERQQK
ncbi:NrdH-redoxin [Geomonas subterranea]|uniref:NrdH-redoxin n=1 Tax=Geomonas subterranea TaxID=2847989 RepID=A0ABX8LHE1_9BACT|nr:glutaredoxin domain-containing protein [Geomonas subterranea]QXE91387.1 NrdH-redoxin [Geomonas subterranea]QXM10526.1 NrdH-redoxin [Geomonas subterranea]